MTLQIAPVPDIVEETGGLIPDDVLTDLALAADPDIEVGDDAVSLWTVIDPPVAAGPLPSWYMAAPAPRGPDRVLRGWRRVSVYVVIVTLVGIHAYGLCNTYGDLRIR